MNSSNLSNGVNEGIYPFLGYIYVDQNNIQLDTYIDGMNDSKINPKLGLKFYVYFLGLIWIELKGWQPVIIIYQFVLIK